jgi:hypothetical protein
MTTPLGEMFMFTIESDTLSLQERRSLLDWVIRPQLRTVPGVADVNALGGLVRSFEIVPDNARMYARGVSINTLQEALLNNNRNGGAGRLSDGEGALLVRSEGGFKTIEDVQNTVLRTDMGMSVRVADVADVRIGSLTRYGAVTVNGKDESVEGLVLGLRGANAQQVVKGIKEKLAEMAPSLPKDVRIQVFYDRGSLVERAVNPVTKALMEAVVLVLILLVLFLANFPHGTINQVHSRQNTGLLSLGKMRHNILHDHHCRIYQHTDCDREPAQTHQIGRHAKIMHEQKCKQSRKWQNKRDSECRTEVTQKQHKQNPHQYDSLHQSFGDGIDCTLYQAAAIIKYLYFDVFRQARRHLGKLLPYPFYHLLCIRTTQTQHQSLDRLILTVRSDRAITGK